MEKITNKNKVHLIGRLEQKNFDSRLVKGNKIFANYLLVERTSGTIDRIPIRIWESLFKDISSETWKEKVELKGNVITYKENGHLYVIILVTEVSPRTSRVADKNEISLEGYICSSNLRVTPFGRIITDLKVACNRRSGRTSYIPTIAWGRDAISLNELDIGTKISVEARMQSRTYQKGLEDGSFIEREVNELSICWYTLE